MSILTLRVNCSSDITSTITKESIENFTTELSGNAPGKGYQWSFIIPLLQPSSVPLSPLSPSSYSSTDGGPYAGPECCVTLPTRKKDNEIEWPRRVESTVPTIFAELILLSGTSVAKNELSQLKDVIFLAIKTHFCPVGQKVWVCVTGRKVSDECDVKYEGVEKKASK